MIKKVVIAAAGRGTRMLHLAENKPKHLIEVNGKPFLYYLLQNLKSAGIEQMCLIVGHKKEHIEDFAKENAEDFNLHVVDQFEKLGIEKYGTAMPILAAQDFVQNEQFIAIYGDNLYSPEDVNDLVVKNDDYHYLSVIENEHPERYGVIKVENDFVVDWQEKPKEFIGNLINTGLYKFTPEIFERLKETEPSARGEYELTDAVEKLALEGRVKAHKLTHYWLDFGKPDDVEIVSNFLNNK